MPALVLAALLLLAGCAITPEQRQAEVDRQMARDREIRREHMRASGALSETEYDAVNRRTGRVDPTRRGLPPPPTTDELERKVEAGR
jgi:hypothetical protein